MLLSTVVSMENEHSRSIQFTKLYGTAGCKRMASSWHGRMRARGVVMVLILSKSTNYGHRKSDWNGNDLGVGLCKELV